MILACHAIFGAYGFWLPNDPRGSWSTQVWACHLRPFGAATKVTTRRSLARDPHDSAQRQQAKQQLKYPPVRFTGLQARAVGRGFARVVANLGVCVYACAIMPDHAHLVVARHTIRIETLAGYFKRAATRRLGEESLHPMVGVRVGQGRTPSPWAEGGWMVYLNTPAEVCQRIRYVEHNPVEAGLPCQQWKFVTPYYGAPRGRGG